MIYLLAFLAAMVGAAAGWAVAFVLAATFLGGSDFEGARGMLAFWGFGPLGGLAGFALGIFLVWLLSRRIGAAPLKIGRVALIVVGVVAGLNIIGFVVSAGSNLYDYLFGNPEPAIVFEVRLPPGQTAPDAAATKIVLRTPAGDTDAWINDKRVPEDADGGRAIVQGVVKMREKTANRTLLVTLPGQPTQLFKVTVPWWPLPSRDYSAWQRADFIEAPGSEPKPAGENAYELHFYIN